MLKLSLRSLLLLVAAVALYLGLRGGYVLSGPDLPTILWRMQVVPPCFAILATLYICLFGPPHLTHRYSLLLCCMSVATPLATMVALAEGSEFAIGFSSTYDDYWDWRYDWLYIVGMVLMHALVAIVVSALLCCAWMLVSRKHASRRGEQARA